ncbi:hypothetical protein Peur_010020 [Populus x canadensis]
MEIGVRYDLWKHMEVDFASTKEKCREIVFAVKGSGFVPLFKVVRGIYSENLCGFSCSCVGGMGALVKGRCKDRVCAVM